MYKKIITGLIFAITLFVGNTARAENYWGIGLGTSSINLSLFGVEYVEDGTPLRLFVGSRNGNFGFEGEMSFSSHDTIAPGLTYDFFNFGAYGLGYIPLNNSTDFYGKLGLNMWNVSGELNGFSGDLDDGIDLAYGIGLNVVISESFGVRAEYLVHTGVDDTISESDGDLTYLTISGVFSF